MFLNLYSSIISIRQDLLFVLKCFLSIKKYPIYLERYMNNISLFNLLIHYIQDQTPLIQTIEFTNFITPYTLIPKNVHIPPELELEEFCLNQEQQLSEDCEDEQKEYHAGKILKNLLDIIEQQYQNCEPIKINPTQQKQSQLKDFQQEYHISDENQSKFFKNLSLKENSIGLDNNNDYLKETRIMKVKRYLKKKQNRNWGKKISYFCRKQVADSRLRIKGRFITRQQVNKIFNINTSNLTLEEIKQLIESKFNSKYELQTAQSQLSQDLKNFV